MWARNHNAGIQQESNHDGNSQQLFGGSIARGTVTVWSTFSAVICSTRAPTNPATAALSRTIPHQIRPERKGSAVQDLVYADCKMVLFERRNNFSLCSVGLMLFDTLEICKWNCYRIATEIDVDGGWTHLFQIFQPCSTNFWQTNTTHSPLLSFLSSHRLF